MIIQVQRRSRSRLIFHLNSTFYLLLYRNLPPVVLISFQQETYRICKIDSSICIGRKLIQRSKTKIWKTVRLNTSSRIRINQCFRIGNQLGNRQTIDKSIFTYSKFNSTSLIIEHGFSLHSVYLNFLNNPLDIRIRNVILYTRRHVQ